MQGVPVRIRVDRNGCDALVAGGADHAHRNLAAVGNEDLGQLTHGRGVSFTVLTWSLPGLWGSNAEAPPWPTNPPKIL